MKFLMALLVGALFFSAPAMAQEDTECKNIGGLIEYLQTQEPDVEGVILNEKQIEAFKARPDLAPPPEIAFDGVIVIHNNEVALIVLMRGQCIGVVARNVVSWPALQQVLGLTPA
jgi:hypothetical protein